MDLTGQICSESIGSRQYSGTGGQNDFGEGAAYSRAAAASSASRPPRRGAPCPPSWASTPPGSVVTMSRNTVDYVITEFGIAPIKGRSVRQRVDNLIAVAHPDFRAELRRQAEELHLW